MTDLTLMERVERIEKQLAALKIAVYDVKLTKPTSWPVVYPEGDSIMPRPAEELKRPDMDLLEWAAKNPEKARQVTAEAIDRMLGGPAKPTPERDANLERATAAEFNRYYHGNFSTGNMRPADCAFLARSQSPWHQRWGTDIWKSGIVAGTWRELAPLASLGEAVRNDYGDSQANSEIVAYVKARLG